MDAIRAHHRALRERLARRSERALARGERDDLNGLIALLEGELLQHARAEQEHLYPAVDEILREHGRPTATMEIDHEVIAKRVRDVTVAVERLRVVGGQDRVESKRLLREALLRLEALLDVHLEKEERVYLPLLEEHLSPERRRELAGRMDAGDAPGDGEVVFDARAVPHGAKHDAIFARFEGLGVGEAFVLVNDHDPRPLSYEFARRYPDGHSWEYLESGPVWRVRLTRIR